MEWLSARKYNPNITPSQGNFDYGLLNDAHIRDMSPFSVRPFDAEKMVTKKTPGKFARRKGRQKPD